MSKILMAGLLLSSVVAIPSIAFAQAEAEAAGRLDRDGREQLFKSRGPATAECRSGFRAGGGVGFENKGRPFEGGQAEQRAALFCLQRAERVD